MEKNRRFSALAYASSRSPKPIRTKENLGAAEDDLQKEDPFNRLVEQIRSEMVAPRGATEEEQQRYHDMLNRAVLGYEAERKQMMIFIHDAIAKRRVKGIEPPGHSFSSTEEAVFAEVIGFNVLELILKDRQELEEIQVIGCRVYEVRGGRCVLSPYSFSSVQQLERIQQNLILFNKDILNPRKRWAEVRLTDGSRVTMTGFGFTSEPTLTIRFYQVRHFELQKLSAPAIGTMSPGMVLILRCILKSGFNIVLTGPTNSGKTHLMKAMIAELPDEERLITMESRFELMLRRDFPEKNVIEYEINDADSVHSGQQAFKLALRQSPKRICHAEIRDDDANIYVRACTRGHEGSMTTVHANELEDVPDAITDMCMMDGRGMDPERLRRRITEYVTQIGIEMAIVGDQRKIVRIGEYRYEDNEVIVRDIVRLDRAAGHWRSPQPFSETAEKRMLQRDAPGYTVMQQARGTDDADI